MERDESAVTRDSSPLRAPGDPDAVSGDPVVHSITDAAAAHSDDMRDRMVKYALAMGIRLVCLILIFVVDGWFKIIAVAGAVFLPWIAVVIANGSDKAEVHSDALLDHVPAAELEASRADEREADADPAVFEGEIVDDDAESGGDETRGAGPGSNKHAPHRGEEQAAS